MRWKKGQSGNPGGVSSPDLKIISETMRRAATQGVEKLRKGADKVVDDAGKGDLAAWTYIRDTLEGKPKQQVETTGELNLTVQILRLAMEKEDE